MKQLHIHKCPAGLPLAPYWEHLLSEFAQIIAKSKILSRKHSKRIYFLTSPDVNKILECTQIPCML